MKERNHNSTGEQSDLLSKFSGEDITATGASTLDSIIEKDLEKGDFDDRQKLLIQRVIVAAFGLAQQEANKNMQLIQDRIDSMNEVVEVKNNDIEVKLRKESDANIKRSIEILGMFSAIMALFIGFLQISTKFSFPEVILILIGTTASLTIFVCAIHYLFFNDQREKKKHALVVAVGTLFVLLVIGVCFEWDNNEQEQSSIQIIQKNKQY